MNDVTRILSAIEQGEPHAAAQLLPLVYDELRQLAAQKLAQEQPGDGSTTIGMPKKSRTCGPAAGTLMKCLLGCRNNLARQQC